MDRLLHFLPTEKKQGMAAALFAFFTFTLMDFSTKVAMEELKPLEVYFFINLIAFCTCSILARLLKQPIFFDEHLGFHFFRGLINFVGGLSIMTAFSLLKISLAYTVIFIAPILSILIGMLVLKEKSSRIQTIGILFGFMGVIFILRPGFEKLQLGYVFAIIGACGVAINANLVRKYGQKEHPLRFIAFSSLTACILTFYPVLSTWQNHSFWVWKFLGLAGILLLTSNLGMNYALLRSPLHVVGSIQYSQLIWSFVLELIFFGLYPNVWSLLGTGLIILGGAMVSRLFIFKNSS